MVIEKIDVHFAKMKSLSSEKPNHILFDLIL